MNPSQLALKALPAHEVVQRMAAVAARLWEPNVRIDVDVQTNVGQFHFKTTQGEQTIESHLAELTRYSREHVFVECGHFEMKVDGGADRTTYGTNDAVRAHIEVNAPGPRKLQIIEALREHFDFVAVKDLITRVNPADHSLAALKLREASVGDLHVQLDKLGTLLGTLTERDVELRRTRLAEMEAEHQERLSKFEAERAQVLERDRQQRQAKLDEIEQAEAALKQKQADYDARESKMVRRDVLKKLDAVLDGFGTFKLSDATSKKRRAVHIATIGMAVAFAGIAVIGGYKYLTSLDMKYLPILSAGLLGFSASMLFYVKWNDRWFREHADEEMQAKRYKADMLRASWVAELTSEWAKEGKEPPAELVEVFARNLFVPPSRSADVEHPADAVLGLMRRAQKVDVAKDRVTVEAAPPK